MKRPGFLLFALVSMLIAVMPAAAQNGSWLDGLEPITAANADRLTLLRTLDVGSSIEAMAWSPTQETLALAAPYGVMLFQVDDLEQKPRLLPVPDKEIKSLAFDAGGDWLVSGSIDGLIHLWDVRSGEQVIPVSPELDGVAMVDFSPDASVLASGGSEGLILWELSDRFSKLVTIGSGDWITPLRFSPAGEMLAFYDLGSIRIGRVSDVLKGRAHFLDHSTDLTVPAGWSVSAIQFSSDGAMLAASSSRGLVQLWRMDDLSGKAEVPEGDAFRSFEVGTPDNFGLPVGIAFNPDGSLLAVGVDMGQEQRIEVWNILTGDKTTLAAPTKGIIRAVGFNNAGTLFASTNDDGGVYLYGIR